MTNRDIVKRVLERLKNEGAAITPDSFRDAYCIEAKKAGLYNDDCQPVQKYGPKLSDELHKQLLNYPIRNTDEFILFLIAALKRIEANASGGKGQKGIERMDALDLIGLISHPSIRNEMDDKSQDLIEMLRKDPKGFERGLRGHVKELLKFRVFADREETAKHDKEIEDLIEELSNQLLNVVDNNAGHRENLSKITSDLDSVKLQSAQIKTAQDRLKSITTALSSELEDLDSDLRDKQSEVNSLKSRLMAVERELEVAKEEASVDFLTGVYTRRMLDEELARFEGLYIRHNDIYAVVFFDIDYFKKVNDKYGHEAGDKVLAGFGRMLREHARQEDIIGRYGGEEFIALLPQTDMEGARTFAEHIRKQVERSKFVYKNITVKVTVSSGVSVRGAHENKELTLIAADQRLYDAKKAGRNRVHCE